MAAVPAVPAVPALGGNGGQITAAVTLNGANASGFVAGAVGHANAAGASDDPGFIVQQAGLGGVDMMGAQGAANAVKMLVDGGKAVVNQAP